MFLAGATEGEKPTYGLSTFLWTGLPAFYRMWFRGNSDNGNSLTFIDVTSYNPGQDDPRKYYSGN